MTRSGILTLHKNSGPDGPAVPEPLKRRSDAVSGGTAHITWWDHLKLVGPGLLFTWSRLKASENEGSRV